MAEFPHSSSQPLDGFSDYGTSKLRDEGYRVTPQRRAILELFERRDDHLTAQGIFEQLEDRMQSLSLATVYNTLELFENTGLLQRVNAQDGQTFYDPNLDPHHHAVCKECGELFDLEIASESIRTLARSSNALFRGEAFEVDEVEVWIRGRCATCRDGNH